MNDASTMHTSYQGSGTSSPDVLHCAVICSHETNVREVAQSNSDGER